MVFRILLAKELFQLKEVIERSIENKMWEFQIQEVEEIETMISSVAKDNDNVAILQVKDSLNFWDLIETLRSTYKNLEIILVSQKPDFNVAYQAIQHRISHFLLEPVEPDNFCRIFTEVEEKFRLLENEKEKAQILMSYELEQHQKLMAKIMTQMMEKPEELAIMMGEVNERYHTKLANTYFCVIQIVILDLLPTSHKDVIINKVQDLCRQKITFGSEMLLSTQFQFELRIVVNMERKLSSQELIVQIEPFVQDLQTLMAEEELKEWAVGIGTIVDDIKDVQQSADWAINVLHNWNLYQDKHLFTALETKEQWIDKVILDQVKRKKYQKYLRQLQLDELEQFLMEEMQKYILAQSPYDTQRLIQEILQLTEEIWSTQMEQKPLEELLSKELFSYLFHYDKKVKAFLRLLVELGDFRKEQRQSKCNLQINKALEYIHHHYNEAITMERVALEVDFSPNYFSNLFREEMGINYLDYVTEYRLKKSKELLEKSDLTLEEIAGEIGYKDVKYYSQLFKKYYEMTPGKYRKSVIEQRKTEG
jgi:two-component system response regulator YesN